MRTVRERFGAPFLHHTEKGGDLMKRAAIGDLGAAAIFLRPQEFAFATRDFGVTWDNVSRISRGSAEACKKWLKAGHYYFEESDPLDRLREIVDIGMANNEAAFPLCPYYYPLPQRDKDEQAILGAIESTECLLMQVGGQYVLALSIDNAKGVWGIAESYMRLGHLPPYTVAARVRFCRQPAIPVARINWVLAGCRHTVMLLRNDANTILRSFRNLRKDLQTRKEQETDADNDIS